jgi:hypothetical protein
MENRGDEDALGRRRLKAETGSLMGLAESFERLEG